MEQSSQKTCKRALRIMLELGINPAIGVFNPAVIECTKAFQNGDIDEVGLMRAFRNLLIFNPSLGHR
jgi:hypothetical protein